MPLLKLSYNSITGVPLMPDGVPYLRLGKVSVLEGLEADTLGHGMASCDPGSVIHLLYLLSLGSSETVVAGTRVKRRRPKVGVIILTSI
jgi:hypothetical protein